METAEAIKIMENYSKTSKGQNIINAHQKAADALKREIKIKPDIVTMSRGKVSWIRCKCPVCGQALGGIGEDEPINYCFKCGQAILWQE